MQLFLPTMNLLFLSKEKQLKISSIQDESYENKNGNHGSKYPEMSYISLKVI